MTEPIKDPKDIKGIQTLLIGMGYDLGTEKATGDDTAAFHRAVADFQENHHLKATGEVDRQFLKVLNVAATDVIYMKKSLFTRIKDGVHTLLTKDHYADIATTTYHRRGVDIQHDSVISGEKNNNASGKVIWYGQLNNQGKPAAFFDLSINDPRFKACKEEAEKLKKEYPLDKLDPKNPKDFAEITRREKAITIALANKIHKQYGDYNERADSDPSTMHDDIDRGTDAALRKSPPAPPALAEFKKNELICRQYAPLASALFDVAGVKNLCIAGSVTETTLIEGEVRAINEYAGGHAFVVSRLTGNVIETTTSAEDAYEIRTNPLSLGEIVKGATIVCQEPLTDKRIERLLADYIPEPGEPSKEEAKAKLQNTVLAEVYNTGSFPLSEMEGGTKVRNWSEYASVMADYDQRMFETMNIVNAVAPGLGSGPLLSDGTKHIAHQHGKTLHLYGAVTPPKRYVELAETAPHEVSPAKDTPVIPTTIQPLIRSK